jgi:hypothetical protein
MPVNLDRVIQSWSDLQPDMFIMAEYFCTDEQFQFQITYYCCPNFVDFQRDSAFSIF